MLVGDETHYEHADVLGEVSCKHQMRCVERTSSSGTDIRIQRQVNDIQAAFLQSSGKGACELR